jgi:mono/diheme cytochrome c family protein
MGTRTTISSLLLATLACSSGPRLPTSARGAVALEIGGDVKGGPFRLGEADLAGLRQGKVLGVHPAAGHPVTYEGVDLSRLEERLELTKGADTLVVRAADQRTVAIPLTVVRQLRPVLALRADGTPLPERELAWPSVEHFGLSTDPRAPLWWMGRVVRMDFVAWEDVYGKALRLPPGAPEGALAGARSFGARCIGCHGMRGAGGASAPDLARGGAFTQPARLAALLPGHPGWSGPGLAAPVPARIPELAAFLRTVAQVGEGDGADEPKAEPQPESTPAPRLPP